MDFSGVNKADGSRPNVNAGGFLGCLAYGIAKRFCSITILRLESISS